MVDGEKVWCPKFVLGKPRISVRAKANTTKKVVIFSPPAVPPGAPLETFE